MPSPAKGQLLLTGGINNVDAYLADTWVWSGTWAQQSAPVPSKRSFAASAFDDRRQRAVLFGGSNGSFLSDTWEWDGAWHELVTAAPVPSGRTYSAMAYFAGGTTPCVVLFGGYRDTETPTDPELDDTWLWDGVNWSHAAPSASPAKRAEHTMAYDAKHQKIVLFGGTFGPAVGYNQALGDTWLWDGTSWNQALPPASPAARSGHRMVYDPQTERVLLFAGKAWDGTFLNDLWAWDGTTWSVVSTGGTPPQRQFHALAYDPTRFGALLFGGERDLNGPDGGVSTSYFNDTWFLSARGGACTKDADCPGAHCVDGVCCESAKCGICSACNLAIPGQCMPVIRAEDPDSCAGTSSCDGLGNCGPGPGTPCTDPVIKCATGFCVDGVCCDTACDGVCVVCREDLMEFGTSGHCGPAKANTDPHQTCGSDDAGACRSACDGKQKCLATCGCDGDHTYTGTDALQDCAPYRCNADGCQKTCASVRDCTFPYECSRDGRCLPPADTLDSSGCTCKAARGSNGAGPWALALLGVMALGWRRRRRSRGYEDERAPTCGVRPHPARRSCRFGISRRALGRSLDGA